ncbi:hypothetical protein BC830DRAFT_287571 [Chytriomyces sp. MP71]|nr:hypothetical protein BC830DRAFT_287571 [Chytriomyces sp. MP71]
MLGQQGASGSRAPAHATPGQLRSSYGSAGSSSPRPSKPSKRSNDAKRRVSGAANSTLHSFFAPKGPAKESPLPTGFTKTVSVRASGVRDATYHAPDGSRFRSYVAVVKHCKEKGIPIRGESSVDAVPHSTVTLNANEIPSTGLPPKRQATEVSISSSSNVVVDLTANKENASEKADNQMEEHDSDENDEPILKSVKRRVSRTGRHFCKIIPDESGLLSVSCGGPRAEP